MEDNQEIERISESSAPSYDNKDIPENTGFKFDLSKWEEIYSNFDHLDSGFLGGEVMNKPIKRVYAQVHTFFDDSVKKKFFSLGTVIELDQISYYRYLDKCGQKGLEGDLLDDVAEELLKYEWEEKPVIEERFGAYLFTYSFGPKVVLSFNYNEEEPSFAITSSWMLLQPLVAEDIRLLIDHPELEKEEFGLFLRRMSCVSEIIVKEMYKKFKKKMPNSVLRIDNPIPMIEEVEEEESVVNLRGVEIFEKPQVSFDDIGGQENAKKELQSLSFALKNPDLYKKWGTRPPKGILLYGPPGTGKTLMGKALAAEADARFLSISASDIGSKWYGDSEKIVKEIFEYASRGEKKTIVFLDEIDSVAPSRDNVHEATQRTLGVLLSSIDGMQSADNVMIVASTNRLDAVDPALKRAGRFDKLVEVPLPDEVGRKAIFNIHCKKACVIANRELFGDIDWDSLVRKTDKLSGSDISEIVRRVLEEKVRQDGIGNDPGSVVHEDFLQIIDAYKNRTGAKRAITYHGVE